MERVGHTHTHTHKHTHIHREDVVLTVRGTVVKLLPQDYGSASDGFYSVGMMKFKSSRYYICVCRYSRENITTGNFRYSVLGVCGAFLIYESDPRTTEEGDDR